MSSAIQTQYHGCLFRSRLEARWAVFFDKAQISWLYEPEGYTISGWDEKKWNYLPDFFLPETKTWIEIKPDFNLLDEDYCQMLQWAVDWGAGLPFTDKSDGTTCGLMLLSTVPYPEGYEICHPILQHYKGGYVNYAIFMPGGIKIAHNNENYFDAGCGDVSEFKQNLVNIDGYESPNEQPKIIKQAYIAARKARFEHEAMETV